MVLVAKPSDLSSIPRAHMRKDRYSNKVTTANYTNALPLSISRSENAFPSCMCACVSVPAPVSVCTYVHMDI